MTEPDRHHSRCLHFESNEAKPLACMAGTAISLGQFRADVNHLAARLRHDGHTLISCSGRYAFSVGLLASWLSDKTVVLPPNQLDGTLRNIRSRFDIAFECDADWSRQLPGNDASEAHGTWEPVLPSGIHAIKLFTSGSTGISKVVTKSAANLLDEARAIAAEFDWPTGPVVAGVPPQHLYGLTFSVLLPWVLGNALVDEMPRYPRDVLQALRHNGGKTLISVPAQYQAMLEDGTDLRGILCVSAAAPLPGNLARQWQQQNGTDILEIYGSTETGVIGHRRQMSAEAWQVFPQVSVSTEQDSLKVKSPFVSDEFTAGFLTGDRVTSPKQGRFQLLGRSDTVVKIAGKRVSLTNIEDCIVSCPGVAEAAVIAVPAMGVVRDLAIWAAVVADGNQPLSPRQLQMDLRGKLEGIEIPRRILVVDRLPCTSTGKLPRGSVANLFEERDRIRVQL
ncbi:MAG: AMP-binding protein [Pseudomonadota bacterium]|nr:AMP-binding protein [Pseudomonadota bacterium]